MIQLLDVCVGTRCSNNRCMCHCGGIQPSRCGNYVPSRFNGVAMMMKTGLSGYQQVN